MNIVLFEDSEISSPLNTKDPRVKHLKKVLRLNLGDSFRSGRVDGAMGRSTITHMDSDHFYLSHQHGEDPAPLLPIKLVIGTPRPNSVKRVLRESSALGVDEIYFVHTELGEKSYRDSHVFNPETVRALLKEGASQAYSTLLPKIHQWPLEKVLEEKGESTSLIFDNHPQARKFSDIKWTKSKGPVFLFIGSERGWSTDERSLLTQHGLIWSQLGQRVLRSDTAFISAVTLAKLRMGLL